METKPWYKSKTVWLNAAGLALELVNFATPLFASGAISTVLGVANIVLRFFTTQGVH